MQQKIWFQKYRILRLLGSGGTAEVYLAEHIKLNSYRAIKCISKNHPLYDLQRNEALILKSLKHSCIPIIYDIEEDEDGSYIVEQYIEGDTLKKYITTKGPIRENILIKFGIQLCDLIHYLHSIDRPILYLDLKPENIIVTERSLKLIDFGSAVYEDQLKEENRYAGTRGYAAPELYRQRKINERCDVYGIGILLYYMATGKMIKGDSIDIDNIDAIMGYSKRLKNIINRCLKYNPASRYASVLQIENQLSAALNKNRLFIEPSQSITVAVAGAQPRIGTTHMSIRLCKYYTGRRLPCIYLEQNKSGLVREVNNCYDDTFLTEGVYQIQGLPMQPGDRSQIMEMSEYQVEVKDFGCLTSENLSEFLSSDLRLLVLGAKDWELQHSEQALSMTAEYKDIIYLFNYMNGRQFQQVMRNMEHRNCLRIPYEPDPYASITQKNEAEFFRELFIMRDNNQMSQQAYSRKSRFRNKDKHRKGSAGLEA